jgi:hypothetical protein
MIICDYAPFHHNHQLNKPILKNVFSKSVIGRATKEGLLPLEFLEETT